MKFAGDIRRIFDPYQQQKAKVSSQLDYVWHMKYQENASFWGHGKHLSLPDVH